MKKKPDQRKNQMHGIRDQMKISCKGIPSEKKNLCVNSRHFSIKKFP